MFNGLNGRIKSLGVLVATMIALGGVILGVETRYGKAADVRQNSTQIVQLRLEQRYERVQNRIWALEDQFGFDSSEYSKYPERYRQEYRQLQIELESIKRQLENL